MRSLWLEPRSLLALVGSMGFALTNAAEAQQFQQWTTTTTQTAPAQRAPAVQPPLAPAPVVRAPDWPKLLPKAAGEAPHRWTQAEVEAAQNSCSAMLKGLDVVVARETPLQEGAECGALAPVQLISVGSSPQVTFSPPVTVTCDMVVALHGWITKDVQASAKKYFGAPIVRVDTMSSYSCRTAYGRANHRLSEHGKANAIDIRAFLTNKAESAEVLANWGPTVREVQARVAAAKAAAEKAKALAASKPVQAPAPAVAAAPPAGSPAPPVVADAPDRPSITIGSGGTMIPSQPSAIGFGSSFGLPSRLGGPKPADSARASDGDHPVPKKAAAAVPPAAIQPGSDRRTQFLREIHVSACKRFGTVLGPEANNAHRNHFHVDMAKRPRSSFCE